MRRIKKIRTERFLSIYLCFFRLLRMNVTTQICAFVSFVSLRVCFFRNEPLIGIPSRESMAMNKGGQYLFHALTDCAFFCLRHFDWFAWWMQSVSHRN